MHRKFFLIGDSTVDHATSGWGGKLHLFIKGEVINKAKSGRSTRSFIAEGRWQEVLAEISPNSYVLIQFGHNDQKLEDSSRGTHPYQDYQENLKLFVETTREKGATPILITPAQRRTFNEQGEIENSLGDYPLAMQELAVRLKVPLIDLWGKTKEYYERLGEEQSKSLFSWYDIENQTDVADDTHFNTHGAEQIAKLVAAEIN
jgi:lysophospholipase L1-like esterase